MNKHRRKTFSSFASRARWFARKNSQHMTTANVISKVKNAIASAFRVPSFAPALA